MSPNATTLLIIALIFVYVVSGEKSSHHHYHYHYYRHQGGDENESETFTNACQTTNVPEKSRDPKGDSPKAIDRSLSPEQIERLRENLGGALTEMVVYLSKLRDACDNVVDRIRPYGDAHLDKVDSRAKFDEIFSDAQFLKDRVALFKSLIKDADKFLIPATD
jgi:hypothetical protein